MRLFGLREALVPTLLAITLVSGALSGCASAPPVPPRPAPLPTPGVSPSPKPMPLTPVTPPAPSVVTATPIHYTLNLAVSPPGSGVIAPSGGIYAAGSQVILQAKPSDEFWVFQGWSGDVSGGAPSLPIVVDGNKNITANFARIKYSLSTSISPPGSGSVSPVAGNYDGGQRVTVVATPAAGYEFERWGGDAAGNTLSANVSMRANRHVTAYFKEAYQVIKYDMPPGSGIMNTVTFTGQLKAGDRIEGVVSLSGERFAQESLFSWTFKITAPLGVVIDDWQGNVFSSESHAFDKTAPSDGLYVIRVAHASRWAKVLTIQIKPGGWR